MCQSESLTCRTTEVNFLFNFYSPSRASPEMCVNFCRILFNDEVRQIIKIDQVSWIAFMGTLG